MNTQKDIQVAAITGGVNTPSARFRVRQYIGTLQQAGIHVEEYLPFFEKSCGLPSPFKLGARIPALFKTGNADLIWLNKELVQGYPTLERLLKKPRILDVDDAIWLSRPLGRLAGPCIARGMDAVVAGNAYLADYFERYCSNVHIVPTGIDIRRFAPLPGETGNNAGRFVIGWTGLACNYGNFRIIKKTLKAFLEDHSDADLLLVSNKNWKNSELPAKQVRYRPWMPDNEVSVLHEMSVGIMPLIADKWAMGKCSFKMLQYMAVGLPVVVSPVGMNQEVLQKGEVGFGPISERDWYDALKLLYQDSARRQSIGRNGRAVVEQWYDAEQIAYRLAQLFKSLL